MENVERNVRILRDNEALVGLCIRHNLGDEEASKFADALKINTELKKFGLPRNQIGDEGAQALAEALKVNTGLKKFGLPCNQIGDEGATRIAEALKVNTTLEILSLAYNQIGDEGATRIAEALKVNTGLKVLYLNNNQISQKLVDQIDQLLTRKAVRNRRKRLEPLQQKCARLIRKQELDCSPIPKIVRESLILPLSTDH